MGLIWLVVIVIGIVGTSLSGVGFLRNTWNAAGTGARRVLASRIFMLLTLVFTLSIGIPIVGVGIGWYLADIEDVGREATMWVIIASLSLPLALLLVVGFMAEFFADVSYYLSPIRSLEELQRGIRRRALGGVVALMTVGGILFMLGIYASGIVLGVGAWCGLLLWVASEYYKSKTLWFKKIAFAVGVIPILWAGMAAIPGSFWLAVHLPNIRPIINFWEGPDNIALDAGAKSQARQVRSFCSRGLKTLTKQISATGSIAVVGEKNRLRVSLEEACGRGDLDALANLEGQIWPPKSGP